MNVYGCIIIVLIILLIFCVFVNDTFFNPSKNAEYFYKKTSGHTNNAAAHKALSEAKKIKNPTALEKFRVGEILLNNIGDIPGTQREYHYTLNLIAQNPLDNPNLFILDRIEADYINNTHLNTEDNTLYTIPYIRDHVTNTIIRYTIPEKKVETLNNKQTWTHDTQSVHDSHVSQSMRDNFRTIKLYNQNEYGLPDNNIIDNTLSDLRKTFIKFDDQSDKPCKGYEQVLNMAKEGFKVINVGTEPEIITEIWRRINSIDNTDNKNSLQHALYESMNDCVENGSLICTQGRITQMLQSMAHLDVDKKIGSMNTTEVLRNDIYKNASDILKTNVETLTQEDQTLYNKGKTNDKIGIMENGSRKKIAEMINATTLNENQKTNMIDECVSVV